MMRRLLFGGLMIAALLMAGIGAASAQEAATAGHPLVGTWLLMADPEPDAAPSVVTFSSDGTYIEVGADVEDGTTLGAWSATGPDSAILTIVQPFSEDGVSSGASIVRAEIEVGADGDSLTASYTLEVIFPDGTSSGEAGPAPATGTRIEAEAPGTPAMTMDELFSLFEEGEEEATPTS